MDHCMICTDIILYSFSFAQVSRHLAKLFDSMAKLKFEEDAKGNPVKAALGMYSKDGEYVDLDKPCDLNGQVRNIINCQCHCSPLTVTMGRAIV